MPGEIHSIHNSEETPPGADFRIDHNGRWYHDGQPITRDALAKLFADRALKIDEDGRYWLATPYEKYPVDVDDVPFLIIRAEDMGGEAVDFITNMEERVPLGPDHVIELRHNEFFGRSLPYVHVRDGLQARLGRNVYYDLAFRYGSEFISRGALQILGVPDEEQSA